jgi:outer membrane protein assembly factor BamB
LCDADADILWCFDIPRALAVAPHDVASGSVLVRGDVLYASTSNGIGRYRKDGATDAVNPDAPAFIALNKYTGVLLATDDTPISRELFHAQWASPSSGEVAGKQVVVVGGSDGVCYAFDALANSAWNAPVARLSTRWTFDANPHHYRFAPDGSPIEYASGDYRRYRNKEELNRSIEAFNAETGKNAIARRADLSKFNANDGTYIGPSEILATPIVHKDRVYILTGRDPLHGLGKGALSCIDATKTGDISESGLAWRFEGIGRSMSTVAVDNGLVYATDLAGGIYCLDANTGDLLWLQETKDEIWGNPLLADGKLYVNARRSFWILAAGRERKVFFTSRGGSECGPIAANGVVYAFIRGKLYAIAKGA